jgi:ABC-type transport system substrate-binding protein
MSNFLNDFWPKKWPTKKQWKKLPEVLNRKEKLIFFSLLLVMLFSFVSFIFSFYLGSTKIVPSHGGVYREGLVQSTRWITINPLYSSQSEVERDIIEVVFDGLMRYDNIGNLIPNIAESFTTEDNKTFNVLLRNDVFWSDGEKLTADDVLFTIRTIQSPDYQSTQRQVWTGVKTEKISDYEVRFTLEKSSSIFIENLTLKPIPKHIFEEYSPRDFRYSIYNIKPISSGPYRFKEIKEGINGDIEYLKLERNPYYFRGKPFLNEVSFHFFRDVDELLRAQRRGEIDGFTITDSTRRNINLEELRGVINYEVALPRFFSVFFNLQSQGIVKELEVREALNHATDKNEFVESILKSRGYIVNSPLLPEFYPEISNGSHTYNIEKAKELLKNSGFENGKREESDPFSFTKDLKENSQGEEVRNLQRCFLYLSTEDEDLYSGEVTGFFDEKIKASVIYFQEKYRKEILDPHNFKNGTGMVSKSTREKLNELCEDLFNETVSLKITLTTLDDPMLLETAEIIKRQWSLLGIEVLIDKKSALELKEEIIRPREFEALLFGTMFTGRLNPFPLWHSTRTEDPGLNLSNLENKEIDELLEIIISQDGETRTESLLKLQDLISKEIPAIFLYNPYFIYSVSEKVKGIEERLLINSSKRFEDIDSWHINTKRVLK